PPETYNYVQRVGRVGRRGHPGFAITYCRRNPHDLYHWANLRTNRDRLLSGRIGAPLLAIQNAKIVSRHVMATVLSFFFRRFPERFQTVKHFFASLEDPRGVIDLQAFLSDHRKEIEVSLDAIVPKELHDKLGLGTEDWIERIFDKLRDAQSELSSDYKYIRELESDCAGKREYKTAEWASKRADTIAGEKTLEFLSRKAVIPKYGFPVDVVELDTGPARQSRECFDVQLQRDLSVAISEFAPTSKLIANKKEWTSYGLKKVLDKEWPRKQYKRCSKHNAFMQWEKGQAEPASACDCRYIRGQYIIPKFGFVTDSNDPQEPRRRWPRMFSTRPCFAGLSIPNPSTIEFPPQSPEVIVQKACPGRMVVLCEGRKSEGFYICGQCGAGFLSPPDDHKTAYGKQCPGPCTQVSLGHEIETDVLQIKFHRAIEASINPLWFAYSLAYALAEAAAEVLEIPSNDLSAAVAQCEGRQVPPIILYDNVPGGAGLVARLEEETILRRCLAVAQNRVSGACGCAENTSCYGCLRSYRNQFVHDKMQRGPVFCYLQAILTVWK
ncbi:MAG: DUF1998 domain-containing protein, partial [Candidatus Sumerlaeia bacterium]|nr:DUF1998 domain-containing protein [Candidatus Sumerlaeia bacterium]